MIVTDLGSGFWPEYLAISEIARNVEDAAIDLSGIGFGERLFEKERVLGPDHIQKYSILRLTVNRVIAIVLREIASAELHAVPRIIIGGEVAIILGVVQKQDHADGGRFALKIRASSSNTPTPEAASFAPMIGAIGDQPFGPYRKCTPAFVFEEYGPSAIGRVSQWVIRRIGCAEGLSDPAG